MASTLDGTETVQKRVAVAVQIQLGYRTTAEILVRSTHFCRHIRPPLLPIVKAL